MTNTKSAVFNAYLLINLEKEWTDIEKLVKIIVKDAQFTDSSMHKVDAR
jgi:hypothetical protein